MAATLTQTLTRDPIHVPAARSLGSLLPIASVVLVVGILLALLPSIAGAPAAVGLPRPVGAPQSIHVDLSDVTTGTTVSVTPEHPEPGLDQ